MNRRKTKVVKIGKVKIGGKNPIAVQSMTKTDTINTRETIVQIKELKKAGCDIVRVAVKNILAAKAVKIIKKKIDIPLVADIHFDYRLAVESLKNGADKIRINPGNIQKDNELKEIIRGAKRYKASIRIGLNSGSLQKSKAAHLAPVDLFVKTAQKYIKLFERENFHDIIISLKSSDVRETVAAYRKLGSLCNYPFHLGITAAGPHDAGVIKSSIGIGALLLEGIGDTVRVSLTGSPVEEVLVAKRILQALRIRNFGPDIVSCPICGRCQVNLEKIVKNLEKKLSTIHYPLSTKPVTIAVMGCEVNGPGEARNADVGIAFGKYTGMLFKKGKIIKKVKAKDAVRELLKLIK